MRSLNIRHASISIVLLALLPFHAVAQDSAGNITLLTGRATAVTAEGGIRRLVKNGEVYPGEILSTGPQTYLNVKFSDGGRTLIRPNSRFQIAEYRYSGDQRNSAQANESRRNRQLIETDNGDSAVFRLLKGGFRSITGLIGRENRENFKVRTPVATIGIRGTNFEARLCSGDCFDVYPQPADGLYTGVFEGGITLENQHGQFDRDPGEFGFIPEDSLVPKALPLRPPALAADPMPDPEACD